MVVEFIDAYKDSFGVQPICRVLTQHTMVKIAPSTYYAAKSRPLSARATRDEHLLVEIRRVHADRKLGRGLYGAYKVWRQLNRENIAVARCTVERLMRLAGLRGVTRGRPFVTTKPDTAAARPPDLVNRDFHASKPNALWVVDFTYVPTWSGMAFTAFVSDVFSRRVVGWRTATSMPTELPLDALEMALWIRARNGETVDGLIHHSDAGSQYTAIRYTNRLLDAGAVASIGTVGDSFDNALAETVVGLYKTECVRHDGPFRGIDAWNSPPPIGSGGSTTTGSTGRSEMFRRSSTRRPTTPCCAKTQRPEMGAAVPPPFNMCRCSVPSMSFVLARTQHGLRALHIDCACAPAELAPMDEQQQNQQPRRSTDLRDNRVSIKPGVLHHRETRHAP